MHINEKYFNIKCKLKIILKSDIVQLSKQTGQKEEEEAYEIKKDGISDLMKLTALTQGELSLIQGFHMGEAILIAGNKRIPVQIQITDEMFSVME